ncbi:ABC transporter permease [Clostridium brassicae]|uniref:ABC transporter permease n=1 Tax=Clostridium brassicae TaxID=2999072 RepID=A0ABT4D8A1_9CLOT|nr:ABC transporter permease [Clostridium brassicae]MCY6958527.1 ABC transporter permease [Clostridium brassicae]
MNSISNLAKKNFKRNKIKSLLVIITIVLTTALLTSMGILCATIKNANIKDIEDTIGNYHCIFSIQNDKQFQTLKNNVQLEKAGEYMYLGNCNNKELGVNRLELRYMDKNVADLNNIKLEKGQFPQNSNEIVLNKWIIEKLNKKPKLGEKIHLSFIPPISKEEEWENKKPNVIEKDFAICGILKESEEEKKYNTSKGLVSKDAIYKSLDKKNIDREIYLRFKDDKNITKDIYSLADSMNILRKDIMLNKFYLNELHPSAGNLIPFIIIGLILMLVAIAVIYNIFCVSISQKIQAFGLLAALGSTRKQMRKVIIIDGLYNCIIGIPLGLLLGYGLSYFICGFVMQSLHVGKYFVINVPFSVIIVSSLVSVVTVVIALIRPARTASKISPIEAIRFSGYKTEIKKKEKKISGDINMKKLSYLNLWRNKKRTLMTLFSLSMSGMIFIIVSSVIFSMDINLNLKEDIQNDFLISSSHIIKDNGIVNPLNEDFIKKVKNIDGVTKVQKVNHSYVWFDNVVLSKNDTKVASSKECFNFYGFDDEMIDKLKDNLSLGEISLENLKNKNEVILVANHKGKYKFNVGDKVLLKKAKLYKEDLPQNENQTLDEIYDKENDNNYKFNEYKIVAIVDKNVEGLDMGLDTNGTFIACEDIFNRTIKDNRPIQIRIDIQKAKYEGVKASLKNIIEKNEEIVYKSYVETREDLQSQFKSTNIICYGVVSIIALIGMLNLINTRITGIMARKNEMGMIEAIGASNKDISKMLQLEGFYYSFISLVVAVGFGLGIGYLCFRLIKKTATYMIYRFPLIPIIILISMFVLLQIIITYLIQRILNKNSIIDKIRVNE